MGTGDVTVGRGVAGSITSGVSVPVGSGLTTNSTGVDMVTTTDVAVPVMVVVPSSSEPHAAAAASMNNMPNSRSKWLTGTVRPFITNP